MKAFWIAVLLLVAAGILVYGMFVFAYWDFNPSAWGKDARITAVIIWVAASFVVAGALVDRYDPKY